MAPSTKKKVAPSSTRALPLPLPPLPRDILLHVFRHLGSVLTSSSPDERTQAFLSVGRVSKAWRSALPGELSHRDVSLVEGKSLRIFSRTLKQTKGLGACVKSLSISISHIWDDFGPKRATTWKGYAFQQVLKSCNQISSLTLDLGPKNASGHLAYLISDLTSTFSSLYHLTSFHLTTASFWFDELVVLLTYWPALTKLELSSLRGNSSSPLPTLPPPVSFKRLIIHSNTLSPQHISWLLRDQSCLTHLEIGLPGVERTRQIFRALEGVALSLVSLRLTNRFTEKGGDTAVEAPSPVLPVLALAPWLTHLELRTTYAGSPASHESLLEALSLLSLRTLWIEDTPTSGLRELVEKGVVGGALKELTKVVSVGVKRGKLAKGDGKEFRKVVEKWGVEWVSS